MFRSSKNIALAAIVLAALLSAREVQALPFYNVTGAFGGTIVPQNAANQTDIFYTQLNGTLNYNEAAHQATLTYTFSGGIFDFADGPQIGTLSGQVAYIYENVQNVQVNGQNYVLALTPNGQGDGVGAFANMTLTAGGISDTAVFDLNAMPLQPIGTEGPWIEAYQPIADYLENNGLGAYLIVGNLQSATNAVRSWFTSEFFNLALGAGRTGNFQIQSEFQGTSIQGTQVPEPASMALLGLGLIGGAARKRRHSRS